MKRFLALVLLVLVSTVLVSCSDDTPFKGKEALPPHQPVKSRFLHQVGTRLVGPEGKVRFLRTVNLGGWLHWESWMFGGKLDIKRLDLGSESQLLERFERYYGAAAARRFQTAILDRFITEQDLQEIAARGFDSVRLPLNHHMFEEEAGWTRLARVVRSIEKAGLGVILDLHAAPGGQSKIFTADPGPVLLWDDPKLQDRTVAIWDRLAREYRDDPAVLAYDLLNEPAPDKPEQLLQLYRRIIAAIRKHDKEHLLMIEGTGLSRSFDLFTERLDANMAYSPHVYLWVGWPDAKWLASFRNLQRLHDTPVWIGEFGEDGLVDITRLRRGFKDLSGWAIWTWKRVEGGLSGGVNVFKPPPAWKRLINSLHPQSKAKAVMDEEQAFVALEEFLAASAKYRAYPGMAKALGM